MFLFFSDPAWKLAFTLDLNPVKILEVTIRSLVM
jgi:hypothetical protein